MNLPFLADRDFFQPILVTVKQQSRVSPWRARIAWLLMGVTVLFVLVDLPFWPGYHAWMVSHNDLPYSIELSILLEGLNVLAWLLLALLGMLIVLAQPANRIGWLLLCSVFMLAFIGGPCAKYAVYAYMLVPRSEFPLLFPLFERFAVSDYGVFAANELPLRELALWIQHIVWLIPLSMLFVALPLLLPNGRLPSKRWRWYADFAVGVTGLMIFIGAFHPDVQIENEFLAIENDLSNPLAISFLPRNLLIFYLLTWLTFVLVIVPLAGLSLIARYRQAGYAMRQQIKWFAFWLVLLIASFVVREAVPIVSYSPGPFLFIAIFQRFVLASLPIFLGISLFKSRLYDIDVVINRTIVYGILTALIVGLYVLIVGLLSTIFNTGDDLLSSLLAVGIIALTFQGAREQLQRGVNRLMFGQRDEPYRIISHLGQQLYTVAAADKLLPTIAETISTALKLPYTAITIRQSNRYEMRATCGDANTPTHVVPLIYQNEHVGQMIVGQRSPSERLTPADERVLEDIARQMSAVVHAVRLTDDLQRSRERLVTAREEERRRLRRDLHDGLGPVLASNTLKLDAAMELVETAPEAALKLMQEVKAQSQNLVADVRRLVYQLRPPMLDELGLLKTLRANISLLIPDQSKLQITLELAPELPPLSAAVEAAAYHIAQEAILNVVKHARARCCTVRVSVSSDHSLLQIYVLDDGVGIPQPVTSGVGLQSIRERAEELGGIYAVKNRPSGGTAVQVQLPLIPMETTS